MNNKNVSENNLQKKWINSEDLGLELSKLYQETCESNERVWTVLITPWRWEINNRVESKQNDNKSRS